MCKLSKIQNIVTILKNGIDIGCFFNSLNIFNAKKFSHYFENYHKHVTVYRDGTGVIINEFDIVFNKEEKPVLKRSIDISDGKKSAKFPELKNMIKRDISERFHNYGFWYCSDDKIISSVKEKYWIDSDENGFENEDDELKNNEKILKWVIKFNYSRIKPFKKYKIIYVMSIPGMYPINNGVLDTNSINDKNLLEDIDIENSTSISIVNKIKNFRYTISFESGIIIENEPTCLFKKLGNDKYTHPKLEYSYNNIYHKYTCLITQPTLGSKIKIVWKFGR